MIHIFPSSYISSGMLKFGLNAWKELVIYLEGIMKGHAIVDLRYTRSFMDHKQLMKIRIDKLYEKGFISDFALVRTATRCCEKAKLAMYTALKYNVMGDSHVLLRSIQNIRDVNETEDVYLDKVISEIRSRENGGPAAT